MMNAFATKRRRVLPPAEAPPDFGPELREARGEVERHYRPDPERPNVTIRGARVVCRYHEAWRRGLLSDAEHEAADRYAVMVARASGARDGAGVAIPTRRHPWQWTPAEAQIAAQTEVRKAEAIVGRDGTELLRLYVLANIRVSDIAAQRNEHEKQAMGRIRAALGLLAEAWGMK